MYQALSGSLGRVGLGVSADLSQTCCRTVRGSCGGGVGELGVWGGGWESSEPGAWVFPGNQRQDARGRNSFPSPGEGVPD